MSSFVTNNVSESKKEQQQKIEEQQRQPPQLNNKNQENIKETNTTDSQIQKETIATAIRNENNVNKTEENNGKTLYEGKCENNSTTQTATREKITTVKNYDDKSDFVVAADEDKTIDRHVISDNNKNLNNTSDYKLKILQVIKCATPLDAATCSEHRYHVQEQQVASLDNEVQSLNLSVANVSASTISNEESLRRPQTETYVSKKSEIGTINTFINLNKETTSVPVATSTTTPLISPLPPLPPLSPYGNSRLPHISSEPTFGVQLRNKNINDSQKNRYNNSNSRNCGRDSRFDISASSTCSSVIRPGTVSATASPNMVRKTSDSAMLPPRRVSFPKSDNELVTGYLEPANPWEHGKFIKKFKKKKTIFCSSLHRSTRIPGSYLYPSSVP